MAELNNQLGSLSKKALKAVSFAVIAFLILILTFFLEGGFDFSKAEVVSVFNEFTYDKSNEVEEGIMFRFSGDDNEMSVLDTDAHLFSLSQGRLWGNTLVANEDLNIILDKVVLMPKNAIFDLDFREGKINLNVYDGDVYLGFLNDGIIATELMNQYDASFMQTLLVPRGSSVSVSISKVNDKLEKLLYLKLVKEFKYSSIVGSESDSDWAKFNLNEDKKYIERLKQNVISKILHRGKYRTDGTLVSFLSKALTFVPEKKEDKHVNEMFTDLNNAIYARTNLESESSELLGFTFSNEKPVQLTLKSYLDELFVFAPGAPQYDVYLELLKGQFALGKKTYVVDMLWTDVYRGLNVNSVQGLSAFDRYYVFLSKMFGSQGPEYKSFISYQNQLVDNLLLRDSLFYDEKYFKIKGELEQEMLRLESDVDQKRELRQAFVSNKINFLKRLVKFFFEEELGIDEAKTILKMLVEEVDGLMPGGSSDVAVTEIFESQLNDIGDFWGYLSSPEYHTSKTYGKNQMERYESYLNDKSRVWSFVNIQEDVLGSSVRGEISILDVNNEVKAIFEGNEDFSDFEIGKIDNIDQRYVPLSGKIGAYPFQADYDRDKGWLKNIYAFGDLVSEDSVPVDKLLDLLKQKFADFKESDLKEDVPGETYAQRVARAFISQKLNEAGFIVKLEDVSVVNELNAVYRLAEIGLKDGGDTQLTFDFKMNGELASNVYLKTGGEGFVLDGEFSLEELYKMALSGDLEVSKSGLSR